LIPGIGADFVPPLLDLDLLDGVTQVTDEEAGQMCLRLAREEGLLVGISSGANVSAALVIARELGQGRSVVTVLPDTGERYVDLPL
jgi:cysteine synthase A